MALTEAKKIPKSVYNINKSRKSLQRNTIYITESDNDFILDEIKHRYTIKYEINMGVSDYKDYFT